MWGLLKQLGEEVIESTVENTAVIRLINGRTIKIRGSDRPDTLRGLGISFVVLDEYADMKPNVWEEIVMPALSDVKGRALFIGTPKGKNHFFELYKQANDPKRSEEWDSFQFNSTDNPTLDPKEIEAARNRMSAAAFKQEYLASFQSGSGGMFLEEMVQYSDEPRDGSWHIAMDPAGFGTAAGKTKSQLAKQDEHAIVAVKVNKEGWFVGEIQHGHWDVREASVRLLRMCQQYRPISVGVEKGALLNAMGPYLEDQMRRLNVFPNIQPLTHGGTKKTDRIAWALQGRFEHGRIKFKKAPWNNHFVDQLIDFPNPLAHDDLVDALAYIDQLAQVVYNDDFEFDEWEPLDADVGF
jgi:phage terminase large subunit-like protein